MKVTLRLLPATRSGGFSPNGLGYEVGQASFLPFENRHFNNLAKEVFQGCPGLKKHFPSK